MNPIKRRLVRSISGISPRFLHFADAATADIPLSRLLRLSLFQVSGGMALVLLVGTLNRVMIAELNVPASLVAIMLALPLVFAPFRTLIGFRSDTHRSLLGWRRFPFIWTGTLIQFGGLAILPFAPLVLAGEGESGNAPMWIGHAGAALAAPPSTSPSPVFAHPGGVSSRATRRCAGFARWASAPWPSACRTCFWSPMAARS